MSHSIQFIEKDKQVSLLIGEKKLSLHKGDVLSLTADALVCPVDRNLDFSSGLALVISQAAGKRIHKERPLAPEPYGKVVVLPGGNLKVKYIFMTVLYGERGMDKMRLSIRQAVERAIRYAEFLRLKSIAFPILGDPQTAPPYDFIAREMIEDAIKYFQQRKTKLKAIFFSAYNKEAFEALRTEARHLAD